VIGESWAEERNPGATDGLYGTNSTYVTEKVFHQSLLTSHFSHLTFHFVRC
jgi:hypothetical protein